MESKILLLIAGAFCFLTAVIFNIRTNNLVDNYDIYSGSSKRQIRNSKLLALGFLAIGLLLELLVIWK